ncbi:MAG: calcium/sodium antiporter [Bacteroidales bacterium]|nr:calcium/sodium antiporter [Bacteroidales bacterium]
MLLQIVILIAGLVLILMGANWLVDGSSSVARRLGISEFVIGLTIVGIGTSAPEMVVSFLSAFQGKSAMAVGNIVGSNIFNTLMILGVTALVAPMAITKSNLRKDIPLNIVVTILLILLGRSATMLGIGTTDSVSRLEGVLLLVIFGIYMWSTFKGEKGEKEESVENNIKPVMAAVMIIGGLAGLIIGGRLFVNSATQIAQIAGLSEKFIAITIMAAGTSLPELATCVVAAAKGQGQLALGNVLGSNIANILLILGGSALIHPLSFDGITLMDISLFAIAPVLILLTSMTFKKKELDRVEGAIFLCLEIAYMTYMICTI